jgi:hypothetical protein
LGGSGGRWLAVCRFVVRLENMTTVCNSRLSGDKVGGSYRSSLVSSEPFKARALSLGVVRAREHMKLRSRAAFPVYPFTSLTSRLNFGPHPALSTQHSLTRSQPIQAESQLHRHSQNAGFGPAVSAFELCNSLYGNQSKTLFTPLACVI